MSKKLCEQSQHVLHLQIKLRGLSVILLNVSIVHFFMVLLYIYAYVSIPQILIKKLKNKDTLKKHIKERIHLFRGLSIDRIYLKNNEYRIGFKYKLFLTILDGQAKRGIYSKYAEKEVRKKCIELAKLLKEKMNVVDKL